MAAALLLFTQSLRIQTHPCAVCAAQQGVSPSVVAPRLVACDVYRDELASALEADPLSAPLRLLLGHPLGRAYFARHLERQQARAPTDGAPTDRPSTDRPSTDRPSSSRHVSLVAALETLGRISEYKRALVPEVCARSRSRMRAFPHR